MFLVFRWLRKNPLVRNTFLILFIWAIKEAITRLIFVCPCLENGGNDWWSSQDARQFYASLFIVVPAVLFWIAGLFLQEATWRCLQGWRVQEKFAYPGRSCACFFWSLGATSLPPVTWLFLLFLDGKYFECIMAKIPLNCEYPDAKESQRYRMISQVIALALVFLCLFLYFCVKLLSSCCSTMTYYEWKHSQVVKDIEEKTFYLASEEYHKADMKKKWKTLFAAGSGIDWDSVSELPDSVPIRKPKRTHYTPFQDWNGVVAPEEKLRTLGDGTAVDTNMVTVTVSSNSSNAMVEVNRADNFERSGGKMMDGRHKRHLAVIPEPLPPHMTYGSSQSMMSGYANHMGGAVIYPPLASSHEMDKYPLMSDLKTSTPKVKRKKSTKKNKVRDSMQAD